MADKWNGVPLRSQAAQDAFRLEELILAWKPKSGETGNWYVTRAIETMEQLAHEQAVRTKQ